MAKRNTSTAALWLGVVVVALIVLAALYASGTFSKHDSRAGVATLTGTVTSQEKTAVPLGSVIEIELQDTSRADAPAIVIASSTITTNGEQAPIPFTLEYKNADIDPHHNYSIAARILVDGTLRWINTTHIPVITGANPVSSVEVPVDQVASDHAGDTGTSSAQNPILGTTWVWQYTILPDEKRQTPSDPNKFRLTFGSDKQLTSSTDCNTVSGGFAVDNATLRVGQLASTKMACAAGSLESDYMQALSRAASYVISGDELRLNLSEDSGTMVFAKQSAAVNLNGSTFRLAAYNGAVVPTDENYTLTFSDDSIHARFCNQMGGSYKLESGVISSKNLVSTLMYCAAPADLMDMESAFSSLLNAGAAFSLEGNTLTLSGKGGEKMVFSVFMD